MIQEYTKEYIAATYLPIGEMLQITKVVQIEQQTIICEQKITEGDWVFPLHFPKDPIFPGSLLIEAAGQVIAIWGWENGLRGKPRLVKCAAEFKSPVSACDELIRYEGKVNKRNNICFGSIDIIVNDKIVGTVTGTVVILQE